MSKIVLNFPRLLDGNLSVRSLTPSFSSGFVTRRQVPFMVSLCVSRVSPPERIHLPSTES